MAERATEYVCVYVCACERTHECMCVWSSGENEERLCMRVCGLRVCTPMLLPFAAALCCYKCSASASSLCVCSIRIKYCDWLWLWLADSLSSDLVSMNACGCLFVLAPLAHLRLTIFTYAPLNVCAVNVWFKRHSVCRFDASKRH